MHLSEKIQQLAVLCVLWLHVLSTSFPLSSDSCGQKCCQQDAAQQLQLDYSPLLLQILCGEEKAFIPLLSSDMHKTCQTPMTCPKSCIRCTWGFSILLWDSLHLVNKSWMDAVSSQYGGYFLAELYYRVRPCKTKTSKK